MRCLWAHDVNSNWQKHFKWKFHSLWFSVICVIFAVQWIISRFAISTLIFFLFFLLFFECKRNGMFKGEKKYGWVNFYRDVLFAINFYLFIFICKHWKKEEPKKMVLVLVNQSICDYDTRYRTTISITQKAHILFILPKITPFLPNNMQICVICTGFFSILFVQWLIFDRW